jgi:hypothetical protein
LKSHRIATANDRRAHCRVRAQLPFRVAEGDTDVNTVADLDNTTPIEVDPRDGERPRRSIESVVLGDGACR